MKYAFVLGRVYTLSLAEVLVALERETGAENPAQLIEASPEVMVVETSKSFDVEKMQRKLGGVVKILQVIDLVKKRPQDSVNFTLEHYFKPSILKKQFLKDYKGKKQFGLSVYLLDMDLAKPQQFIPGRSAGKNVPPPQNIFSEPKRLGMFIKKSLADSGMSIRLVLPEFNSLALASVVVTKNLLLQKGAEICILAAKDHVYTAKTCVVQDFEDYGRRDYQRPVRDEQQGMIPPKVAQVMLNLAGCKEGSILLDPFCGIGTVVQEGLLLGFRMLGSDLNKTAINGSERNLEWFRNRYKISPGKYHLETCDARKISPLLAGQTISAVVTECTLGPMYGKYPKQQEIDQNFKDLTDLYKESLEEFAKFLPSKARVVMCIPAYKKTRDSYEMLPNLDFLESLGYNMMDIIPTSVVKKFPFLRLTQRNTAIYDRKDQVVAREIVIFEKN
jgi:tRNA G10  N-methylase Trm11